MALLGLVTPLLASVQNSQNKWSAPKLTPNPSAVSFGSVSTGNTQTQTVVISNTGSQACTLSNTAVTGSGFKVAGLSLPVTVGVGQSISLQASFSPQAAGSVSGTLSLTFTYYKRRSLGSMVLGISLSGMGVSTGTGAVVPSPTSLGFGTVQAGSSKSMAQSITNSGTNSVTISQLAASGTGFGVSGVSLPQTLSAGQSYSFNVTFSPTLSGTASGNLAVLSNASNSTLNVPLSGTGATLGQLSVAPSSMGFGSVIVGQTQSQTANLAASGSSVTVSSIGTTDAQFMVSGVTLPKTIAAGTSASFTVTYTPQATGSAAGNIAFVSNATTSPITLAVSGSGASAPQHSVSLSWNPSSNVAGYNVYRSGTSSGPYTKINSALDVATTQTDSTVLAGQTYYYVVTAVDSNNVESGYSAPVGAVVPSP